jgi:hypothetical protein
MTGGVGLKAQPLGHQLGKTVEVRLHVVEGLAAHARASPMAASSA